jgi:hypothetical protein
MLFRNSRREKLASQLGRLAVPMYADSLSKDGAQRVLDRLVTLHAHLRAKAGLPKPEHPSLDDVTDGFKALYEIQTIALSARQHVMTVPDRRPVGSPSDKALAEQFARDVINILERLQRYYDDVI